jgi:hypothetical protein
MAAVRSCEPAAAFGAPWSSPGSLFTLTATSAPMPRKAELHLPFEALVSGRISRLGGTRHDQSFGAASLLGEQLV